MNSHSEGFSPWMWETSGQRNLRQCQCFLISESHIVVHQKLKFLYDGLHQARAKTARSRCQSLDCPFVKHSYLKTPLQQSSVYLVHFTWHGNELGGHIQCNKPPIRKKGSRLALCHLRSDWWAYWLTFLEHLRKTLSQVRNMNGWGSPLHKCSDLPDVRPGRNRWGRWTGTLPLPFNYLWKVSYCLAQVSNLTAETFNGWDGTVYQGPHFSFRQRAHNGKLEAEKNKYMWAQPETE